MQHTANAEYISKEENYVEKCLSKLLCQHKTCNCCFMCVILKYRHFTRSSEGILQKNHFIMTKKSTHMPSAFCPFVRKIYLPCQISLCHP